MKILNIITVFILLSPYAQAQTKPVQPGVNWQFKAKGAIIASPVVNDGLVYFGSLDSSFYALDVKTGSVRWKFGTGGKSARQRVSTTIKLFL
ncbi:MAG: PQQ-binding-like beta-propeller repeat protein [Bacteroidota bacterium]